MKRTAIGAGVYLGEDGRFWARPWINRRRTWRLLKAVKERAALKEANTSSWNSPADNFAALAALYLAAHCPNRRLEGRPAPFCDGEKRRLDDVLKYFGPMHCDKIRLPMLPAYKAWRVRRCNHGSGERAVDKDIVTLSNVLNYGVAIGQLEINYIRAGRPRFRRAGDIRHCRFVAPDDADTIHKIADLLFEELRSEVLGWLLLFSEFTGCRTSELLRLRVDADTEDAPGYVHGKYLYLRRSKGGVNPFAMIGPEFEEMLKCFQYWHRKRFPKSQWYFPSHCTRHAVNAGALGHALTRVTGDLKLKHITPHGIRSFYVTKRRSDGANDAMIAGEIGDKTVILMQTSYGNRPPNWTGGDPIAWVPKPVYPRGCAGGRPN